MDSTERVRTWFLVLWFFSFLQGSNVGYASGFTIIFTLKIDYLTELFLVLNTNQSECKKRKIARSPLKTYLRWPRLKGLAQWSVRFRMNLWGHRFSQNASQKFEGFLPYPLIKFQGRNLASFWLAFWEKWWPHQFILNLIDLYILRRPQNFPNLH